MIFPKIILLLIIILCSASCSVFMAASHKGTSLEELQSCRTKSCILSKDVEVLSNEKTRDNGAVVTCKVRHVTGSTGRAVMHGLLDVATLGIWEVAGTPIEGAEGQAKYYTIKVHCDKNDNITKVELVQ